MPNTIPVQYPDRTGLLTADPSRYTRLQLFGIAEGRDMGLLRIAFGRDEIISLEILKLSFSIVIHIAVIFCFVGGFAFDK